MHFDPGNLYHIYNRGNNGRHLYDSREHYLYFLSKAHRYLKPRCDILAWCLLPGHFNFLVRATDLSCAPVPKNVIPMQHLTEGIRLLLSSYTKGLNKQRQTTGNLFQQKTRTKWVQGGNDDDATRMFRYIHQLPLKSGFVASIEGYEFCSFPDYVGKRNGTLCNRPLAYELLHLNEATIYADAYQLLSEEVVKTLLSKRV
ncbi:MAG: hypothetical protein WKF70_02305 [Chitinophagaceae bacterium]